MNMKYVIMVYLAGAIAKNIEIYKNRKHYIEFTREYIVKTLKLEASRFRISYHLAILVATWPLDIILDIYFRFFYKW